MQQLLDQYLREKAQPFLHLEKPQWVPNKQLLVTPIAMHSDADISDQISDAYWKVFRDDPVWQEGAYCSKEGWQVRVPFSTYQSLTRDGEAVCQQCGAPLIPCQSSEKVKRRLVQITSSLPNGFFLVLQDSHQCICGFSWGIVTTLQECLERISLTRYSKDPTRGKSDIEALGAAMIRRNVTADTPILYSEETGILKDHRSLEAMMLLMEQVFTCGLKHNVKNCLFWTSPKTTVYQLSQSVGFEPCAPMSDGFQYMVCRDLTSAVALLRGLSPMRFAHHSARVLQAKQSSLSISE